MSRQNNESRRLETVRKYLALKVNREEELQNIVTMAAAICESPIGMITIMDETMQYVRFVTGIDIEQNERDNSFCQYMVNAPVKEELMIVPDATTDERFKVHPFVVGEPNLRFMRVQH